MSPRSSEAGFTLVEMLVVVAIIGLVGALVVPRLAGASGFGASRRLVATLKAELDEKRRAAIASGQSQVFAISDTGRGAALAIADDDGSRTIVFLADGSSSGGAVTRDGRALMRVDRLTGHADDTR